MIIANFSSKILINSSRFTLSPALRLFIKVLRTWVTIHRMADHSVIARDELHESEASEASVFCFDNASPEKSCFMDGLVCFILLCLRVFEFLNATRRK